MHVCVCVNAIFAALFSTGSDTCLRPLWCIQQQKICMSEAISAVRVHAKPQ